MVSIALMETNNNIPQTKEHPGLFNLTKLQYIVQSFSGIAPPKKLQKNYKTYKKIQTDIFNSL